MGDRDEPVMLYSSKFAVSRRWASTRHEPNSFLEVLLICRDFYYAVIEAYGRFCLEFEKGNHSKALTRSLGGDRIKCIKHVEVNIELAPNWKARNYLDAPAHLPHAQRQFHNDALADLPSLQTVKILIHGPFGVPSEYVASVQEEIRQPIKSAWSSKAGIMEFNWPLDMGCRPRCCGGHKILLHGSDPILRYDV